MIKKISFLCLLTFCALLPFISPQKVEARSHCRSRTQIEMRVGNAYGYRDAYVTRRYARPVIVPTPVYISQPAYASPYTPVYAYPAPAYYAYPAPAYVEEVYMAPELTPQPIGLTGLSFSWSFFK